jgi:hypothetical protein
MAALATVAVQGVNQLLEEQKALSRDGARFTLTLFNNKVSLIHDAVPLGEVPPMLPGQYEPSGGTALNDAVAHLIRSLGSRGSRGAVLAVILTDGEENGSKTSREDVRQMVTYRRITHGWQFILLGPSSAVEYGLSIGIPRTNIVPFETTGEGLRLMLERLGKSMSAYRLGDRQFMLKLRN